MSVPTLILKWCLANKINSRTFFDKSLARELLSLLSLLKVRDVADFGCGPGWYTYLLYKQGYKVNGYDGNPHVKRCLRYF